MTNLFDYLKETGNNIKNKATSLDKGHGLSLYERMFGQAEKPTDSVDFMSENTGLLKGVDTTTPEFKENMAGAEPPMVNITASQTPRKGGIFPDITSGYKENRTTPANLSNFGQNKLEDGRDKGFAYRLGEGLGSLARFGESPLGRSLLVGGIIGANGGSGLEALVYGGTAGMLNQNNRTADKIYRNSLEQQGIDTSNLQGYVNSDMYKNASLNSYRNNRLKVQQSIASAKDNTIRANMILKNFENGILSEDEAIEQLQYYGIDISELQPSNATKNITLKENIQPYKIDNLKAKTNTAYINAKNNTERTQAYVNFLHGKEQNTKLTPIGTTQNTLQRVKAPNGSIHLIPQNQVNAALQAGGQLI